MKQPRFLVTILATGFLVAVLVSAAVTGLLVTRPSVEAGRNQAQFDLVLEFPKQSDPGTSPRKPTLGELTELVVSNIGSSGQDGVRFAVDSFFDVFYVRNIGSSGQDGVRFGFDSFFDIEYQPKFRTIETEMIALSLSGSYSVGLNESQLIDKAKEAAASAGGDIYYGHVTVLK